MTVSRALYRRGAEHIDNKRWKQAYEALYEAWALKRHWQIAMMLGWAELELGKIHAAVEHLSFAAADTDAKDKAFTERIAALLLDAKAKLVFLRIDGAPAGARLLIDDEMVGTAPMTEPVQVDLGAHVVTCELGPRKALVHITVLAPAPGETKPTRTATLVWPKDEPASASQEPVGERIAPKSMVPVIVLGAGAGVGVVLTGVFAGLAVSKKEEARTIYEAYDGPRPCSTPDCVAQGKLLHEYGIFVRAALGVGIGSVLMGAAAGGVYLLQKPKKANTVGTAVQWVPVVSPSGGGLVVRGNF